MGHTNGNAEMVACLLQMCLETSRTSVSESCSDQPLML